MQAGAVLTRATLLNYYYYYVFQEKPVSEAPIYAILLKYEFVEEKCNDPKTR
jgi:hypothetical protein